MVVFIWTTKVILHPKLEENPGNHTKLFKNKVIRISRIRTRSYDLRERLKNTQAYIQGSVSSFTCNIFFFMKSNNSSTETDFFCSHRLCQDLLSRSKNPNKWAVSFRGGIFLMMMIMEVFLKQGKRIGISIKLNLKVFLGNGRGGISLFFQDFDVMIMMIRFDV